MKNAPVSGLTLALPTFDSFCQKHGLQQDKMRSHGGVWAEIALEAVHKAVREYVLSQKPVGKCLTYEEANQASLKSPFVWYGELPYGKNLYAEPLIAPPVNFSDSQIKEAVDAVDFSQMVTADDFIYMVARAGLALAAPSKANGISVDSLGLSDIDLTEEVRLAGEQAWLNKCRDMESPAPTEFPGEGPAGACFRAMVRAIQKRELGITEVNEDADVQLVHEANAEAPAITNKANRKLRLLTPAQREKLISEHHAVYRHPASFGALDALIRTVELKVASLPD